MLKLVRTLAEIGSYDINTDEGRMVLTWAVAKLGHEASAILRDVEWESE